LIAGNPFISKVLSQEKLGAEFLDEQGNPVKTYLITQYG